MELRVLRYFLTVVREESITKAAEVLHITQPTLSRQLSQMEEEIGVTLFYRGTRKISLTNEGILLRRRAEEILQLVDKTEKELVEQEEQVEGKISIGCGEIASVQLLPELFRSFREKYPRVSFDIFTAAADLVKEQMDKGLLDLGLLLEPVDMEKYDFLRFDVILNIRWYGSLFRGKYRLLRIIQTVINFSVLASMLCLAYSGIVLSRHVFAPLLIHGPMATARKMHMAASYWGFVLMSFHLGMHWGMITGMFGRLLKDRNLSDRFLSGGSLPDRKRSALAAWVSWLAAALIAGYGLSCFIRKDIASYMFLKIEFVFFDFEQSMLSVFLEYTAMMGFWIFAGFSVTRGIGKLLAYMAKKAGDKK